MAKHFTRPDLKTIDWVAVHARVAAAQAAMEREFRPDAHQTARILRARARALAAEPPPEIGATIDIVAFMVAGETYGIEARWVTEVCPLNEYTPLPGTPPFVLGIMNLRGRVLSIIDLRRVLALTPQGMTDLHGVLVLSGHEMEFGVLADSVLGLRSVLANALTTGLPTLSGSRERYLYGISPDGEIILDGEKLLSDPQLVVRD